MPTTAIDVYTSNIYIDGYEIHGLDDEGIPFPQSSTGTKDISSQDSGNFADKGLKRFDPGTVTLSGYKMPGDRGQGILETARNDRQLHTITVQVTGGDIYTYSAYIIEFSPDTKDNSLRFVCKLSLSGKATKWSSFVPVGTITFSATGTTVPATYTDAWDLVNAQSNSASDVTMSVTSSGATITYSDDNGTTWKALSTAVTLGSAGTVKSVVLRWIKSDAATRFMRVFIAKAS